MSRALEATLRNANIFSPSYRVGAPELADLGDAIRRRGGAAFMHRAAGFVDEHRRNATRWDLEAIARELRDTVAIHMAGSEEDPSSVLDRGVTAREGPENAPVVASTPGR